WRDLNCDQIYALLDRTFTSPGQAVLYTILKNPCCNRETLLRRSKLIKAFQKDVNFREKLQLVFLPLERVSDNDMATLLWGGLPSPSPYAPLYTILAVAALISLFTPLFLGKYSVLLITGMFSVNSLVHYKLSKKYEYMLPAISGLAVLLRVASKVTGLNRPVIHDHCQQLRKASLLCRPISRNTAYLQPKLTTSDLDILYEYLKLFFLLEVRAFYAILSEFGKQVEQLQRIYLIIGELDALQSIASYRESLPMSGYVEPELIAGGNAFYAVENARHPLLKDAVANSILINKEGVLVTGSNMSGKSTFLRTVGVNAIFAQTIFTCLASSYRGSFFRVVTSISREDSLMEGKSFYYQEAERLLKLIQTAAREDTEAPALCIIDELLSGTNYTERFAASQGILSYLAYKNARVLAATHDLDLAEKLQGLYRCYHFTDQVGRDGLKFDFKLKEGIASTRNAIKLLEYLQYPGEIVQQANTIAGQYTLNLRDLEKS
ncbi:MAG TPA: hypothetical protein GX693_07790, partial [Firmicutes bacterium]|nr:hypothetical protein [Bacillota bacterium]